MRLLVITLPAVLWAASGAAGQDAHHRHEQTGPAPQQLGRVDFPTTCAANARRHFERGVALLHSFWYEESAAAFRTAVAEDSGCSMGYWGQAMSLLHPLWAPPTPAENQRGLAAADSAVRLSVNSPREHDYAQAIRAYFQNFDSVDHRHRLLRYEEAMAQVSRRHPRDDEARILYALALIGSGQLASEDTSHARQRRAGEMLEPLFRRRPDHPGLAHYLIHAYDSPALAARGVSAAQRYARIAPSVPHAQHMPSHIYVRVGRWDDVIASNLRSAESARRYELQQSSPGLWDQHGHALDYLAYGYLQEGRDREAARIVARVESVTAVFPEQSLPNDYALAAIPARYALEREDWSVAERLSVRAAPTWRSTEAITWFARALGAARLGHLDDARLALDSLTALEQLLAAAGGAQTYWSRQVGIQRMAASAWAALGVGDTARAIREAGSAADLEDRTEKHPVTPGPVLPARELYGDLLLAAGRPPEALQAYASSLARQPRRLRSLVGAARAAARSGNITAAREYFSELEALAQHGDGTRPDVRALRGSLGAR